MMHLICDFFNAKLSLIGRRIASHRLKSSSSVTSANGDTPTKSSSVTQSNLTNGSGSGLKKSTDSLNNVFSPDGLWLCFMIPIQSYDAAYNELIRC